MTTFDDNALRAAAGDYVAGDLDPAETTRFQAQLADQPALAEDIAFWQRLRPGWTDAVADDGLSETFADSVLARVARESQDRHRIIRLPLWAMITTSALAAALAIVVLLPAPASDAQMYAEDGAAMVATRSTGPWERYVPRALVSHVNDDGPDLAGSAPTQRAWAGFWTRPVRIHHDGQPGDGLLVLRVAGGSPADNIGLRPGDIIRSVEDCPVFTSACIAAQLHAVGPGQTIGIDWWRPSSGEQRRATLQLEALYE